MKTYSLSPEQYWAVYEAQGRKCAICQRATGASRRFVRRPRSLRVATARSAAGNALDRCCVRRATNFLGTSATNVQTAERIKDYLLNPPGRRVLDRWP
ncbi:endonuclease domain-containing protein [Mycobacteroides abscessus]|uniref:endonuclease domain-containing protein n=1 Tax=Mycobacteroides abscessus TaxID=36809 RepID=UPI001F5FF507|nr:endonuclease domain-containing protein [Mycobacteroides abscessus]